MHDTDSFHALVARKQEKGYAVSLETLRAADLPAGDVTVDIEYSSLNYKDALAVTARGKIIRRFPMVLGIDLAGTVAESSHPRYRKGDRVVGVAQGLGETEWGGYAQRQRVSGEALVPLPDSLSTEDAMRIGTAGFTAMLCLMALEDYGLDPGEREVVVTGAAGGVGSLAVMLLARKGWRVAASTGRPELEGFLRGLGATSIVTREELARKAQPLESERWGGAVDTVGGDTLATLFAQTVYEGAIACCGMAGGHELQTTVWPLILRNVALLGVSSLRTSFPRRVEAWGRLASEIDRTRLSAMSRIEPLSRVAELSEEILAGRVQGRIAIDVSR
jgi:putative YhdH/YhfP family quinone oxidoreductase